MPPRLNKRQQRELEELSALEASKTTAIVDDDEDETEPVLKAKPMNRFLVEDDAEGDQEEDEDEEPAVATSSAKRKKKKSKAKKKTEPPADIQTDSAHAPTTTTTELNNDTVDTVKLSSTPTSTPVKVKPKNEKKAAKRAKAKEKKAGDEELDAALAELAQKYHTGPSSLNTAGPSSTISNKASDDFAALLAVSLSHLDPEAEMRKFFGSRVVSSTAASSSSSSRGSRRSGAAAAAAAKQKSNLTRPKPTWWSASQREGLSIRALTQEEIDTTGRRRGWGSPAVNGGEKWWTVEYSQRYKSFTKLFIQAVMSGHPDALWEVQRKLSWHADNLLQLAEVYRHREEYAQAVDFVDRALFTYERAFVGAFTFTTGSNRLDFDRVENRPFFLAVHRQIADLQRRGCTRTAFEFARLLYGLDPHSDPHGALFHLDFLAIKGGMGEWLDEVWRHFEGLRLARESHGDVKGGQMDPCLLPGWAYARAVVLRIGEGDKSSDADSSSPKPTSSTQALIEAIQSFPEVVPLLADKLEVSLPDYLRAHQSFKVHTDAGNLPPSKAALHALAHMYTSHSSAPWKDPSYAYLPSWFLSTITSLYPKPSSLPSTPVPNTPRRETLLKLLALTDVQRTLIRHITVLENTHRRLLSFLPKLDGRDVGMACDPVVPDSAVSKYDQEYFEGVEDAFAIDSLRRGRGAGRQADEDDERILNQLMGPVVGEGDGWDRIVRGRILTLLRGIRPQFGGGLRELMERLGPAAVDEVLGQMQALVMDLPADAHVPGAGVMPGGLGDAEEQNGVGDVNANADGNPQNADNGHQGAVLEQVQGDDESDEDRDENETVAGLRRVFRNTLGRLWNGVMGVAGASSDEDEDDDGDGDGDGDGDVREDEQDGGRQWRDGDESDGVD